ncbi:MAG: hypothetical protein PHO07_08070 [Pirellulales bacterium]|jgi:4-amino-4-deoxy-L-arabinose transferase-like glycosyltransferase|nr:hypothetical protein [Thermoguttaceae bacterium]MDD4787112.1 hypothetical protein [Pirellulales bacterium]MDI9442847.1 hypothetical protein [Planctomycetota bacterium]NLZ03160.1 hypothetical protein [Pirellulaceae bacterium]
MTHPDESTRPAPPRPDRLIPAALLVLTLVVRAGIIAATPQAFDGDPDAYRAVAGNLVEHGCLGSKDIPTATRPPLYPLLLAACLSVDAEARLSLAAAHVLLALATVFFSCRLAERWGLGRWAPAAAVLVAVDPILLAQSTLVMTETLATLLAAASLLAVTACAAQATGRRAAAAGGLIAAAALCRPTFLPWLGLVIVLLPWFGKGWRQRARLLAAAAIAAAVVLGPWAARNALHFGKPTPATNHGGFTLLLANNPSFYDYLGRRSPGETWNADQFNSDWSVRAQSLAPGDEVAADRLAYADACQTIRSRPRMFAYACLVRLGRTWALLPHRIDSAETARGRGARWAVAVFYAAESLLALVGLVALARGKVGRNRLVSGWSWGLLLVVVFTAVHTVFWTNMRMRAPLIPVVAAASAAGLGSLWGSLSRRKPLSD